MRSSPGVGLAVARVLLLFLLVAAAVAAPQDCSSIPNCSRCTTRRVRTGPSAERMLVCLKCANGYLRSPSQLICDGDGAGPVNSTFASAQLGPGATTADAIPAAATIAAATGAAVTAATDPAAADSAPSGVTAMPLLALLLRPPPLRWRVAS